MRKSGSVQGWIGMIALVLWLATLGAHAQEAPGAFAVPANRIRLSLPGANLAKTTPLFVLTAAFMVLGGLGEHRAHAAMAYLAGLGVPAARLTTTSYGKEKPVCTEATESCWGRNRRAHFTLK